MFASLLSSCVDVTMRVVQAESASVKPKVENESGELAVTGGKKRSRAKEQGAFSFIIYNGNQRHGCGIDTIDGESQSKKVKEEPSVRSTCLRIAHGV